MRLLPPFLLLLAILGLSHVPAAASIDGDYAKKYIITPLLEGEFAWKSWSTDDGAEVTRTLLGSDVVAIDGDVITFRFEYHLTIEGMAGRIKGVKGQEVKVVYRDNRVYNIKPMKEYWIEMETSGSALAYAEGFKTGM